MIGWGWNLTIKPEPKIILTLLVEKHIHFAKVTRSNVIECDDGADTLTLKDIYQYVYFHSQYDFDVIIYN